MFEPSDQPRLFGCAPGVDFPRALLDGLTARMVGTSPDAMARVTILVNTQRMARRLRDLFEAGPPRLLPRIGLLTQLDTLLPDAPLAPATPALRRLLELEPLVAKLIEQERDLNTSSASFDLARSLAQLMDEMQGEGVSADRIMGLDVSDQSGHWARAQKFFGIAQDYINATSDAPDPEARQRATVLRLAAHWANDAPRDPILIAGSTGSRGTTQLLMEAVARLPQGALILPGFDFDSPDDVWARLTRSITDPDLSRDEDHPQFRFAQMMHAMGVSRADIAAWSGIAAPAPARNRLVSLALRPAPITDAWRAEGPALETQLPDATQAVTLIEAETSRAEATAIALRLRQAAEDGERAALVTPDRMLTRQVTAALDRWGIRPDDSAGVPLHLSPPGRFLRHVADLMQRPLDAETLITLLKHPLTHSAGGRPDHQINAQRLELRMRRDGLPYPTGPLLIACAARAAPRDGAAMEAWATWLATTLDTAHDDLARPLTDWVARHLSLAEALADGPTPDGASELWQKDAGEAALAMMQDLAAQAEHGGVLSARDYGALVSGLLAGGEVRNPDAPHPSIMIWGTLEARVQGADLVILAGLNDGTWPEAPPPDPWLNRKMRADAGLLLPERRVGLSAHDFQQAVAAPDVWLTRAIRSDDAETVPSRWINRLRNLMTGLPQGIGATCWQDMQTRGAAWLAHARVLDAAPGIPKAPRPAPCPPVAARPRRLTVTEIQTLIRDPYAIYAKHSLRLRPLRPLVPSADALLRGILLHDVMERFVRETVDAPDARRADVLMRHAQEVLASAVPWPAARTLWHARIARAAQWITDTEGLRQSRGTPVAMEKDAIGRLELPAIATTIEGRADRIDLDPGGNAILYDYKSSLPPSAVQQRFFDKQLLIEAAMVEAGGFATLGPRPVVAAQFIGLSGQKTADVPLDEEPPTKVLADLVSLLSAYLEPYKGYTSRRALYEDRETRDFDQLARFGEWDVTDDPIPQVLT
ncbi:double-strand break repair protein AddB [uncultured Tateyamaria sp.]|uniref:double-strand break repair protein AddB n=1 Tax=Tateyamaria sp. 1078 TaxID=3417464 RepID=UPI00262FF891|nr:double-strand break repair protein AddB [uncultured Tateyamaria sp.]